MPSSQPTVLRRHRVVALVGAPQSTFELLCAAEVFGVSQLGLANPCESEVCTELPGSVPTLAGYDISVTAGLAALRTADTVVIPGCQPRGTSLSR